MDIREEESGTTLSTTEEKQEEIRIPVVLERANRACLDCRTITPILCAAGCSSWRMKNELRKFERISSDPSFLVNLLNTLKNERRLHILEIVSQRQQSIDKLQKTLKMEGYYHSKQTIMREYVDPLIDVGLLEGKRAKYRTTVLGCRLAQILNEPSSIERLPPHSECYEERTIESLSDEPKTYNELKAIVPAESVSRIIKRLQESDLIRKDDNSNYIYHLRTRRDPSKERLSPTERRLYEGIPQHGASAKELAERTNISLRRTYKYLRKLRGKKLTFKRRRPKTYALSQEGERIARILRKIRELLDELSEAHSELKRQTSAIPFQRVEVPGNLKGDREKALAAQLIVTE